MKLFLINAPIGFVGEMSRRGHDLMVVDAHVEHMKSQYQNPRCRFEKIWGRRKINLKVIKQMRKAIREFEPDVVHAFLPSSLAQAIVGSAGLKPRPKVVSFRGITRVPTWLDPAEWITYLSPRISMHACESHAVMKAMQQGGVRQERCTVTYNCVTPADSPLSREEACERFGLSPDSFVVGTAACIRPVKGIDLLIRAAAECSHLPNIQFLLLGQQKDPHVDELAKDPRLKGRIKFAGHVPDAQRWMKVFDVFVMPSRREGLCRALLEAMDLAVCPVVSDAGGMKEMVRNGLDGIVVPTEDAHAIQNAIVDLYHDRSKLARYGSSAQVRVRDMCSPENFTNRLESMYLQLCAGLA
jgi:L-malate glycosyltransferase